MPNDVYWDSCMFIEVLQRKIPDRCDACDALVSQAKVNDIRIVTSVISLVEVNKPADATLYPGDPHKVITEYFENPYFQVRQVTRDVAELARKLAIDHKLTNLDAIHVATAVLAKVSIFYTYDGQAKGRRGLIKQSKKINNLVIDVPPTPTPGPLFLPPSP